jgi:hypothetical protein
MEPSELLAILAKTFDGLKIRYLVTGSMATIAYGEPRFTNDIDVVVDLRPELVDALCSAFPAPDYYLSREAVHEAIRSRRMFNIIHPASGLKIDVIVPPASDFEESRQGRGRLLPVGEGLEVRFASPEDVIIRKLEYFREGGSEKHLRDIVGVLKIQAERIDRGYVTEWARRQGVEEIWETVVHRSGEAQAT